MLIYYVVIFIFGLIIGSFLNVVIHRLGSEEKIVNDRSKCVHCGHVLAWNDLIPVLSYIMLGGKCRYCKEKISGKYLVVEITTGILFALVSYRYMLFITNYSVLYIFFAYFTISALIIIFFYDLKTYIIPDEVLYPAIIVAIVFNLFTDSSLYYILTQGFKSFNFFSQGGDVWTGLANVFDFISYNSKFINHLFAAVISFSFFFSIVFFTGGKGMGGGDVKLGFLMGMILGWPMVFLAIFLSFIIGSIAGLILVLKKKKDMKSMIPFGPFLVTGALISLFWGEGILKWYLGMIN